MRHLPDLTPAGCFWLIYLGSIAAGLLWELAR